MANGLFNLKQVVQAVQQGGWPAQKTPAVEYLVVAGGGGGGRYNGGGGGGAGGLLAGIDPVPNGQTLLVTVGGGGAGGTNVSGTGQGISGSNSVFGSISAIGGGGGGGSDVPSPPTYNYGLSGGSGGGSGTNGIGFVAAGQGTFGQGTAGGRGNSDAASWRHGGGGGGAGTIGSDVSSGTSGGYGNGGSGIASAINGVVTAYAGGGGGGGYVGFRGIGGVGGGGNGGESGSGFAATAGTANTGGGGGGGGGAPGAAGGSGIVIVSYPDVYAAPTATTGSPTVSTSGSGSSYFNGSTWADYPASTSNYATGDFTVESWVYFSTVGAGYTLWISMDPNTTYFGLKNANNAVCNLGNGTELVYAITSPSTNTWYHYAFVRSGTAVTLYINGVSQGAFTSTATLGGGGGAIRIGNASGYALTGNLSNVRYTKSAVYTSAFTPPTAPLTAIANTRLLLNTVSPSPFNDSSGIGQIPTVTGTSSWNASSPFATGLGYKNRVYTWTSSGSITF